jgi:hypothetical protein
MNTNTDHTAAETILEALFEGGSLTVYGIKAANGWRFKIATDEGTMFDLLSDEDRAGTTPSDYRHEPAWVDSWDDVLASLNERRYWHMFCAEQVHPDFRQRVWTAVRESAACDADRGDAIHSTWVRMQLERWERVCHGKPPFPVDEMTISFDAPSAMKAALDEPILEVWDGKLRAVKAGGKSKD